MVFDAERGEIGGAAVSRLLPLAACAHVGPFVYGDHVGPVDFGAGQGLDVVPHPHIGLAALTYLFEGELVHRDDLGVVRTCAPGDVHWMVAGRGYVHSERSPPAARRATHRLHGLQLWAALPDGAEAAEPSFTHVGTDDVPRILGPGIDLRVLAGQGLLRSAPVPAASPLFVAVGRLARQMRLEWPAEHPERAVYVMAGQVVVAGDTCGAHQLAKVPGARTVHLDALEPSWVLLLAGAPVGPRHVAWNFVASRRSAITAALARWKSGGFGSLPHDPERAPLPP